MKKIIILAIVLIVISLGIFLSVEREYKESDVVKIGVIAPLSGSGSVFGSSYLKGAQLALEEIDNRIEIIAEDSKFEGKTSIDAANFLINVKNIDFLVTLFHLPAQSVSPIAKERKIPFVYEAFTVSMVEENPYAFKSNFDAFSGCRELIDYARGNEKYEKIGLLIAETEYGRLCFEGMKEIDTNVREYWYNFGDTDFRTILTRMNNDGIDHLMTLMIDFEYLALFKQLTELGYPIKVICATASECIYPQIEEEIPSEVLEGTLAIDFIPADIRDTSFGERYISKYGNVSSVEINYAALGYEMIKYVTPVLELCEPKESECIVRELDKINNYESILGSSGFKDRILQLENNIYSYKDGVWELLK